MHDAKRVMSEAHAQLCEAEMWHNIVMICEAEMWHIKKYMIWQLGMFTSSPITPDVAGSNPASSITWGCSSGVERRK